jgi:hypothetical protein
MSRRSRISLNIAVALTFVTYGWYFLWSLDHGVSRTVAAPDAKYKAYFMLLGEGEKPPYGQAVKVAPAWNPLGHVTGPYLFKGHCAAAQLMWEDARRILLSCNPGGRIVQLAGRVGEIEFRRIEHAQ